MRRDEDHEGCAAFVPWIDRRRRRAAGLHRFVAASTALSLTDPGCVKNHTSEKCGKNTSPTMRPTSRVQYDLTFRYAIARRCFYVRGKRWSFHTTKTLLGPPSVSAL